MRLVKSVFLVISLLSLSGMSSLFAQNYTLSNDQSQLSVTGTSSLHDWTVNANVLDGKGDFVITSGTLTTINKLTFFVSVKALKGEKSGMNKKIQSALQAKKHKTIAYQLKKCDQIKSINTHTFLAETEGFLTIADTTKKINLLLTFKILNNTLRVTGTKNLKMTDFNIRPPKALLGMIKTGDAIKVTFEVLYQQ